MSMSLAIFRLCLLALAFLGLLAFEQSHIAFGQQQSSRAKSLDQIARTASVRVSAILANGARVSGAGFVVGATGHVITSFGLVKEARRIVVFDLEDEEERVAKLAGTDNRTGIAVLAIDKLAGKAVATRFGDAETVAQQMIVCATCRSDSDAVVEGSVAPLRTAGRGNPYESLVPTVQVDHEALGSALFGLDGAVLAMISAIVRTPDGTFHTLAVPSRTLQRVSEALIASGKVERGWLGVNIDGVGEGLATALGLSGSQGALVIGLAPGGPAEQGLLERGDIILEAGRLSIAQSQDVVLAVSDEAPGTAMPFKVLRQGKVISKAVRLGNLSDAVAPPSNDSGQEFPAIGLRLRQSSGSQGVEVINSIGAIPVGARILSVSTRPVTTLGEVSREIAVGFAKGREALLLQLRVQKSNQFSVVDLRRTPR